MENKNSIKIPDNVERFNGYFNHQNGCDWIRVYGITRSGNAVFICGSLDSLENRERYSKDYGIDRFDSLKQLPSDIIIS